MKIYKHRGETFELDDSQGCYVEVTYKTVKGWVGVNLHDTATDESPYSWYTNQGVVTPDGLRAGNTNGSSFASNLDALCVRLVQDYKTAEAAKALDREKYCHNLHDFVKQLPEARVEGMKR